MKFKEIFNAATWKTSKLLHSQLFWIQLCAIGIFVIAIHDFTRNNYVYVVGGELDANVNGVVETRVDDIVDVNLEETLGRPVGSHRSYTIDGRQYEAIDVYKSNW
jgi:hypothetical protein